MAVDFNSLTSQTNQLLETLAEFKTVLKQEANLLSSNQLDQLFPVLDQKSLLSANVDQTFKTFNKQLNNTLPLDQLAESDVFKTYPEDFQKHVLKLIDAINECYDLNISNGIAVQIMNNLNETAINIFTGQTEKQNVYGASGTTEKRKSKTSLGKA